MNDRFKFRVWDKINDKWMSNQLMDIEKGLLTGFYNDEEAFKRRYIIMQCTGLKDKNGTLIFEGDVVKHSKSNQQYKVQWNDKGFWQLDDYAMARSSKFLEENYEVIGNLYENKELLQESEV